MENCDVKLLIVEDDPFIALDIKGIVENNNYEVVNIFHNAEDTLNSELKEVKIALLDITIEGEMNGIELGTVLKNKYDIPCIFISSYYDKDTVTKASKANPLAYIIKPYEEQDILTNLELSKNKLNQKTISGIGKSIFVKSGNKLTKITPKEVSHIQAYDMYTYIFYKGNRILASQTLKEIQKLFEPFNFMRVHRSYMVNFSFIDGICEDEILIGEHHIPIGRTHKKELFARITTI